MGRRRKHNRHLPARVYQRGGGYYYVHKSGRWEFLGSNLPDAMSRYGLIHGARVPTLTLAQIMDRYEAEILTRKAPRTQADYRGYLRFLRASFGNAAPEAVRPVHIRTYMDEWPSKSQANKHRACLSDVLAWAIQWGYPRGRQPLQEREALPDGATATVRDA